MASSASSSSSSSSTSSSAPVDETNQELLRKVRGHEVAISELKGLSASRAIYQKSGNLFFRKDVKTAMTIEQEQLDLAKAQLQKSNTA